ncbi:MAG: hypothetical protein IKK57_04705 [Clostridia bacterium]|nr:hypothetical protein [Clostridia bacterium]
MYWMIHEVQRKLLRGSIDAGPLQICGIGLISGFLSAMSDNWLPMLLMTTPFVIIHLFLKLQENFYFSTIHFEQEHLVVKYPNRRVWRTIAYNDIQHMEIRTFTEEVRTVGFVPMQYICLFMGDNRRTPDDIGPWSLHSPMFFAVEYTPDVWEQFCNRIMIESIDQGLLPKQVK